MFLHPLQLCRYCILAKTYGAGVGLSINKTAMEYPGTGTQVPLDKPITVEGLKRNETYIFAVAAYDDTGALIGGLGASSKEVRSGRARGGLGG